MYSILNSIALANVILQKNISKLSTTKNEVQK